MQRRRGPATNGNGGEAANTRFVTEEERMGWASDFKRAYPLPSSTAGLDDLVRALDRGSRRKHWWRFG
jgi:hypothetical protein